MSREGVRVLSRAVNILFACIGACVPVVYNLNMAKRELTHIDGTGRARMVDVGDKSATDRWAFAKGEVIFSKSTLQAARQGDLKKGDLITVAELAGLMAAKRTSELIPLCHPLPLDQVVVRLSFADDLPGIVIEARVRTHARTGAEMEALTAVSVAALTIYDMVKALEKETRITNIRLIEKGGGKSGHFQAE